MEKWLLAPETSQQRMARLGSFNKDDLEFHSVVAKCQLRLARGANHPWGVAALKPRGYSAVKVSKKVCLRMAEYSRGLSHLFECVCVCVCVFFFSPFYLITPHVNIPTHYHSDALHM